MMDSSGNWGLGWFTDVIYGMSVGSVVAVVFVPSVAMLPVGLVALLFSWFVPDQPSIADDPDLSEEEAQQVRHNDPRTESSKQRWIARRLGWRILWMGVLAASVGGGFGYLIMGMLAYAS